VKRRATADNDAISRHILNTAGLVIGRSGVDARLHIRNQRRNLAKAIGSSAIRRDDNVADGVRKTGVQRGFQADSAPVSGERIFWRSELL
jgi:hypothetical protein